MLLQRNARTKNCQNFSCLLIDLIKLMQRTLPAYEQVQQVDQRVHDLKDAVISNIKDSQILRSNFTTMLHTYKDTNDQIKEEVFRFLSNIQSELFSFTEASESTFQEMQQEILGINFDRRNIQDEILLLDQRVREVEEDFGIFKFEEI